LYLNKKNTAQQAVIFAGADDADAEFYYL